MPNDYQSGKLTKKYGKKAEDKFAELCTDNDLNENKAFNDSNGWDYIVQEDTTNVSNVLSIDSVPLKFLSQVKHTRGDTASVRLTYTNMKSLIDTPLPSFIFFVMYNIEENTEKYYLKHIDSNIIDDFYHTLAKKRDEIPSFQENTEKYKTIKFQDLEVIDSEIPYSLRSRVLSIVGKDMTSYIENKKNAKSNSGYESGEHELTFYVDAENEKSFINTMLGQKEKFEVRQSKLKINRFGILHDVGDDAYFDFDNMKISPVKTKLEFKNRAKKEKIPVDLYYISNTRGEVHYRIKGKFLEIRGVLPSDEANVTFNLDEKLNSFEMTKMNNIFIMLSTDNSTTIKLNSSIGIFWNNFYLDKDIADLKDKIRIIKKIESECSVNHKAKLSRNELEMDNPNLRIAYNLIVNKRAELELTTSVKISPDLNNDKVYVLPISFRLGDLVVTAICSTKIYSTEEKNIFKNKNLVLCEDFIINDGSKGDFISECLEAIEEVGNSLNGELLIKFPDDYTIKCLKNLLNSD